MCLFKIRFTILKFWLDPLCLLCKEDSETSLHFLDHCAATAAIRRDAVGKPIMSSETLTQLRLSTLLKFVKALYNLTVGSFGVAHWTRTAVSMLGGVIHLMDVKNMFSALCFFCCFKTFLVFYLLVFFVAITVDIQCRF